MEQEKALTQTKPSQISTHLKTWVDRVSDVRQHPAIIGDLKASISEAMQSPPVRQLINSGANMEGIEQVLAVMVLKYAKMLHIGGTIGTDEPRTIAKMLIQEYPLNSLDDFNVMFLRGVTGRYGKVMGFDISVIFGWAMMFQDEWASEREKLMDKVVEPEPAEKPEVPQKKIDVDKLLADHLETLRDTKMRDVPKLTPKEIREEGQSTPPRKRGVYRPTVTRRDQYIQDVLKKNKHSEPFLKAHESRDPKDYLQRHVIDGFVIVAKDEKEAQEIFTEVYM